MSKSRERFLKRHRDGCTERKSDQNGLIHRFDEFRGRKDQGQRQAWDENNERCFEIRWQSLSSEESEGDDDE